MELFKSFSKEKKAKVLAMAKEHREADRFVQGTWLKDVRDSKGMYRGCFFGCMTQRYDDVLPAACNELEIPAWIVYVSEKIFEGLPEREAVEFPVQLLEAIPAGVDTEDVWKKWNIALLTDQLRFVDKGSEQEKAILGVIEVYSAEKIDESAAWSAARSAAWSAEYAEYAARSAAWSAAESAEYAARSAARSAAWSAAESAEYAAESAEYAEYAESAESAAESAESAARSAESDYYTWMRDTLIKLLSGNE